MESTTVGIDLAKHVFSICVMDDQGRVIQRLVLKRDTLKHWLVQLPAGTPVAMEACSSAHHWGRFCQQHQLTPRLMAAQFVQPFRKSGAVKNDRQDAEAIATAARQGNMRFVPVKTLDQQARLSWHRVREGYKCEGLAVANRIRGLLAEFDVPVPQSKAALRRTLARLDELDLPLEFRELIQQHAEHWQHIEALRAQCEVRIRSHADQDPRCLRLRDLIGVGPLTADAIVATLGNARDFKNGRQCAAWLGLTPSQHGTGGRVLLGRISCRGDSYLRTLLIQGARSSLQRAKTTPLEQQTYEQRWILQLAARLPFGKVLAAIANKHARQIWAMLAREASYDPDAGTKHPLARVA